MFLSQLKNSLSRMPHPGVWIAVFFSILGAEAQLPALRQFNLRQGLPQSEVTCLLEDSRGLVWAGTRGGGLVQFDGNSLRVFNAGNGLSSDFISDIGELPDGRLAVVSSYGGIQSYDGKGFSKTIKAPESEELFKAAISKEGKSIGIHSLGVSLFDFDKGVRSSLFSFPQKINKVISGKLIGNRWLLVSVDSGLYSVDTKSRERSIFLRKNTHLNGRLVVACQPLDGKSAVLVSADGYVSVLDYQQGWPLPGGWQEISGLRLQRGEEIRFVIFGLGQYMKWITTNQNRLISLKSGDLDLSRLNGMKIPGISALLSDKNGTVWLGTMGSGILVKPVQSAYSFSENSLLAYGRLNTVLKTRSGQLLCGGMGSGLVLSREGNRDSRCLFPESDVFSLAETQKYILAGTANGIRLLRKNDLSQVDFFSEPGKTIRFHVMPDDRVLIGTFGNGAWLMEPGKKPKRLLAADSDLQYPYEFLPYGPSDFLIPSNTGLWRYRFSSGMVDKIGLPDSIPGQFFLGTRDLSGNYWFSSPEGLVRLSGKKWSRLTVKNGLSSSLIYTLNADSVGNVWVGGSHGLDKISLDGRGRIKEIRNYGPEEGFDGYEANMRASFSSFDFLYVCTIQGLFAMPVKEPILEPLPGKPEITSLMAGRRNGFDSLPAYRKSWFMTGQKGIVLEQQADLLVFDFRCINPVFPSKIKYSYRIASLGQDWSKPSSDTRVSIPGPEAGRYSFEVRSTYDGVFFSEPSRVDFSISVPWYLGKLFLIPALLFIAVLFVFYLKARNTARPAYNFFRKDLRWSDSTGQLMLLLFAAFYPLLPFLAARFDSAVCLHPAQSLAVVFLLAGFFLVSVLNQAGRNKIGLLLKLSFVVMVADSSFGMYHNSLVPFYVALLFSVSGLAFLIFSGAGPVLIFGLFLNGLAYYCSENIEKPLFNPTSFQIVCAGLSVVLVAVVLARQSSEEKLLFAGKVVNEGPVLVLDFDPEGNLIYASDNLRTLTGYGIEELSGKNWWEKVFASEADRKGMEAILTGKENKEIRIELKTASAETRIFRFNGKPLGQRFMVFLGEDISENEFLESRFENLVENAADSIFQTDLNGRIQYSNPESSQMLGLKKEELIGRNYTEFVIDEYRDSVRHFYQKQLEEQSSGSYKEFPLQTGEGEIRWMAFQTSMLYKRGGSSVEGLLAIGRDITERIEAEKLIQLQHKNITDSITYASRIRSAFQPEKETLSGLFTHFAIFDEPKDIIGGDFFWLGENGHSPVFVLGDCTGHGVPGAFMTTISMGLLREGVMEEENQNLEKLLGKFNRSINQHLGQNVRSDSFDFAEVAMISLDHEKKELLYISSGIGLHRVRNGEIFSFPEASRGLNFRYDYSGMGQRIPLEPGDVFYLCTDGVYDQIGGPGQKRFSKNRLKELILHSDRENLETGMEQIQKGLYEWQESSPQIDDRMMISFRI